MEISLEHIPDAPTSHTFRITFFASSQRFLLAYPESTSLTFCNAGGEQVGEWGARFLGTAPQDDFVLAPNARIAFDIRANINNSVSESEQWNIELPPGNYSVHFSYHIARDTDWYDFLQKRSRFVDITPIWQGSIRSNSINFELPE